MNVNYEEDPYLEEQLVVLKTKKKTAQVNEWISYIEGKSPVISGRRNGQNIMIPSEQISRFYTSQKKVYAVYEKQEMTVASRLYELEARLPQKFIRISNTEIINLDSIKELSLTASGIILITLKTGAVTSSSRRYLKRIKEQLEC